MCVCECVCAGVLASGVLFVCVCGCVLCEWTVCVCAGVNILAKIPHFLPNHNHLLISFSFLVLNNKNPYFFLVFRIFASASRGRALLAKIFTLLIVFSSGKIK